MTDIQPQANELVQHYIRLTGREARVSAYEFDVFNFFRAGFTCEQFVLVVTFIVTENKKNKFQYSLRFGKLVQDHARFMDLLEDAKARERNKVKPSTPKEAVLEAWRGCAPVSNGNAHRISDFLKQPHQ